jgi:hypothetical protein
MRMCIGKWLKIQCYSLWVQDFPFQCFIFIGKKNRLEVYCSVFLLFSRCIDHFISYSHIVYTGYRLGHVICLLIYFRLAAMLLNILKCISMFILLLFAISCQSLYYQYILDRFHFLKSPKIFRVIITITLCCPCYMPKYVPRLEGIMHFPSGRALCLLTLGHISAYNMDMDIPIEYVDSINLEKSYEIISFRMWIDCYQRWRSARPY